MSVQQVLNFFGIGDADADTIAQGKRRTGASAPLARKPQRLCRTPLSPTPPQTAVTWLSFIVFCVFVGAVAGPDWVKGGIEFDDGTGNGNNNNPGGQEGP